MAESLERHYSGDPQRARVLNLATCTEEDVDRLIDLYSRKSWPCAQHMIAFTKRCLVYLDRLDLAKTVIAPVDKEREKRVQEKLLTAEERSRS